jgi:hypothetical protein
VGHPPVIQGELSFPHFLFFPQVTSRLLIYYVVYSTYDVNENDDDKIGLGDGK